MADISASKILTQYEEQQGVVQHSEYICTNLDFMAGMAGDALVESFTTTDSTGRTIVNKAGRTSTNTGHDHEFIVDEKGNGIAKEACSPDYPNICHSHKIINWVVQSGGSKSIDPKKGIAPHKHSLLTSTKNIQETQLIGGRASGTPASTPSGKPSLSQY